MILRYNLSGKARKQLAETLGDLIDQEVIYEKAPSFAYTVGEYTVDKTGSIICPEKATKDAVDPLIASLDEAGFKLVELVGSPLIISFPKAVLEPDELLRLRQIILNKATLFEHAFKKNIISLDETDESISFPWFTTIGEPMEIKAYNDFVTALLQMAKEKKRVLDKPYTGDNDKFAMRLFLVQLNLKGAEYKDTRKILMRDLDGNSAWRYGKPEKEEKPTSETQSQPEDLVKPESTLQEDVGEGTAQDTPEGGNDEQDTKTKASETDPETLS